MMHGQKNIRFDIWSDRASLVTMVKKRKPTRCNNNGLL